MRKDRGRERERWKKEMEEGRERRKETEAQLESGEASEF